MGKRLAIITARGGSKRIPRKNIKDFCGKPIIAYSIEAAIKSKVFDTVMVSTDDNEIAEISKGYGAEVPFMRSEAASGDYATTRDVLMEVLDRYRENGIEFEYMSCIYPTAPLLKPEKIQEAMELMEKYNPVEIMPVIPFSYPPQRCFVIDENNKMKYKYEQYIYSRSQDLEKYYHDVGQFYVFNVEKYKKINGNVVDGIMPLIMNEMEVQDIDNEEDWAIAELKYKLRQKSCK